MAAQHEPPLRTEPEHGDRADAHQDGVRDHQFVRPGHADRQSGVAQPDRDVPRPRADERRPWTAEQAVTFLAHCLEVDPKFADLFAVIIGTGLRKGEALGLHRENVRLDESVMYIRHTLSAVNNQHLALTTPKTKKSMSWAPLSDRVAAALTRAMTTDDADGSASSESGFVFRHEDSSPLHPAKVRYRFHTLRKQAGLPHITIHDLRHLAATLSMDGDVPMPVVSKTLRHSTLSTTANIYSHLTPETAREAVDAIQALLDEAELQIRQIATNHTPEPTAPNTLFSHAA